MTSIREVRFYQANNINVIGNRLIAESGDSKSKKFFSRGFPLPFNVETLQAFGADQNNTVKSLSSGNNRKNIFKKSILIGF
jgi:hypothetical protein